MENNFSRKYVLKKISKLLFLPYYHLIEGSHIYSCRISVVAISGIPGKIRGVLFPEISVRGGVGAKRRLEIRYTRLTNPRTHMQ